MANTSLFSSIKSWLPRATATNEAGGAAYRLAPKHALAQIAATGCFGGTYYASGESQLDELRKLIDQVDDNVRRALFGWLTGKETAKWAPATETDLPEQVQSLAAYRRAESAELQTLILGDLSVRWDLLADAAKGPLVWKGIARQMGPQALRMSLNTLLRHEVFSQNQGDTGMVDYVAARIADADEIRQSRQFPYQYLTAYLNAGSEVPQKIKTALHQAAEIACGNIPQLAGPVVIGLDTSGSMSSPVTGHRGRGATTKMRCVDVAALFAAAILRRNPDSVVVPFDTQAYQVRLDPSDSILSLAERLARYGGGGTDCSLPLREAKTRLRQRQFAGAVLVSDTESWVYRGRPQAYGSSGSTGVMTEWQQFVQNQKRLGTAKPKLVCMDLQSVTTTQALDREDILNIGGFSDAVFSVVASFLDDSADRFVTEIEKIEL